MIEFSFSLAEHPANYQKRQLKREGDNMAMRILVVAATDDRSGTDAQTAIRERQPHRYARYAKANSERLAHRFHSE
jgi:hypothetical protein